MSAVKLCAGGIPTDQKKKPPRRAAGAFAERGLLPERGGQFSF